MHNKNILILTGNLTKDLEEKVLENGGVANTGIAFNSGYFNKNKEWVKKPTEFFNLQFGNFCSKKALQHLKKGSFVEIKGSIKARSYKNEKGENRIANYIEASSFIEIVTYQNTQQAADTQGVQAQNEDDLPF